jgi:hypothetical protein
MGNIVLTDKAFEPEKNLLKAVLDTTYVFFENLQQKIKVFPL